MEITLSSISYEDKLTDINYIFESGKITAVMGKSGSGKSLIGYAIMGLVGCDKGSVMVDDMINYDKYQFMKDVGYVFQNPKDYFFCETVYEEIAFGLKQFRFKLDKLDSQVMNALKMVGLDEEIADRKINTLSSGELQRVAIASSLVLNPKVLILDEPTVYMDYGSKCGFIKLVKMLKNKYGKTIIVMSNDADFIYDICDNYLLIDRGKVIKSGKIGKKLINDDIMYDYGVEVPLINKFVKMVRERRGVLLKYTNNIDDLVMDVSNYEG